MTTSHDTLQRLLQFLHADDPTRVEQGVELLATLDDDTLNEALLLDSSWAPTDLNEGLYGSLVPGDVLRPDGSWRHGEWLLRLILSRVKSPATERFNAQVRSYTPYHEFTDGFDFATLTGFTRMERVRVEYAPGITNLDAVAALSSLVNLNLRWCDGLTTLDGLASDSLQTLAIDGSLETLGAIGPMPELRTLTVQHHPSMRSLVGAEHLPLLETLSIGNARFLTDLRPLGALTALRRVHLHEARELASLDGIEASRGLESLQVPGAVVTSLAPLRDLRSLGELSMPDAAVSDLAALAGCLALRTLDLTRCPLASLDGLQHLVQLERLDLGETPIDDVLPLAGLSRLRELRLSGSSVTTLDGLPTAALERIDLDACAHLRSLTGLKGFAAMRQLDLTHIPALASLDGLQTSAPSLTRVTLDGCDALRDLTALRGARSLQTLSLLRCLSLATLAGLEDCAALHTLSVTRAAALTDLSALASLGALTTLSLLGAAAPLSLGPIASLPSLEWIDLREASGVTDLTPLLSLPKLRGVTLYGSGVVRAKVPRGLRARCHWKVMTDLDVLRSAAA